MRDNLNIKAYYLGPKALQASHDDDDYINNTNNQQQPTTTTTKSQDKTFISQTSKMHN